MGSISSGEYRDVAEACENTIGKAVEMAVPDKGNAARYQDILPVYKEAYLKNKGIFHELTRQESKKA
ncbi:MAG: hypothetical protein AAGU75_21205, partial [Bacillota bacterium]